MNNKHETIQQLNAAETKIQAFLATVSPDTVVHPDTGWTVKDVIAHMTDWNWQMLKSCAAGLHGGSYQITPFIHELHNWQAYRAALTLPWKAVHGEWLASHATVRSLAGGWTDAHMATKVIAPWGAPSSVGELIGDISRQLEDHWPELQRAA